jgi:hypothetical protein
MSDISERILVRCPVNQAARHLSAFIRANGNNDGDVMRVRLCLPLEFSPGAGTAIERPVIATVIALGSAQDPLPTYSISWAPETPGPFPNFVGALAIANDESYDAFRLVLAGHYDPPFGPAGTVFDSAVGRRIAHACTHHFLEEIRDFIEAAHTTEEAKKRVAVAH